MTEEELKTRTKQFALRVMRLVKALLKTTEGWAIGGQLIRSGTSVGCNYRAACRARSSAEFISRLGVVEEEADESCFWLELIIDSRLLRENRIKSLLQEGCEIVAIISSSRLSAKRRANVSSSAIENRKSKIENFL